MPRVGRGYRLLLTLLLLCGAGVGVVLLARKTPVARALGMRPPPGNVAERIAYAAEDIVDPSIVYDAGYVRILYPGGDVAANRGVCADVVVRAYRRLGIDLQVLVHQDMQAHFSAYPRLWGLRRPDPNIDHRRVFNLMTFFTRNGQPLRCSTRAEDYQPGDIVAWRVQNQGHIGIVSRRKNWPGSRYLVVHNIGRGQVLEDMLFSYPIIGHYRYQPDALRPR